MLYNAKNGTLTMDGTTMDYIRFGTGEKILIMLPGLGDGLRSMKGTALPMALMYRRFARDFTVYAFSRKHQLPPEYTTREMARDLSTAMDALGIKKAHLFGVSMGGMIAQHFAADFPERVEKLVLTVTCPHSNPVLTEAVGEWIFLAEQGDHTRLLKRNLERIYSKTYCKRYGWMVPILGKLTKPASYQRFLIQAQACLTHNALDRLPLISAQTLVIGGQQDRCLGGDASRVLADRISDATLKMYPDWGHGLYEEAPDFVQTLLAFLLR